MLGPTGPVAELLEGYVARDGQQEMARAIQRTLEDGGMLIAESGTGTGKTLAYLVPALLSGQRVLVVTGTKNLQEQLYFRDLPLVREALQIPVTTALLKGRANYLCTYRLEQAETTNRFEPAPWHEDLLRIRRWAEQTDTGDIAEVGDVPEKSDVWWAVTSTSENCLGAKCPRLTECHVLQARGRALAADVLVINHHLFFADLVIREDGFGQLLPGADAVIFDEAHKLPDLASEFFGTSFSGQQVVNLCRDTTAAEVSEQSGIAELPARVDATKKAVADLRLALGRDARRMPWLSVAEDSGFKAALENMVTVLDDLVVALEAAAVRGEALTSCWQRGSDLIQRVHAICEDPDAEFVRWIDITTRSFVLRLTPLDPAIAFREKMLAGPKSWVFTSATLTVKDDFSHFRTRLGVDDADTAIWQSPFDFSRQALMYLPDGLPEPQSRDYTRAVVAVAEPVIEACTGGVFMLFTSHRALRQAAGYLRAQDARPVFVQGDAPRSELLDRFRATGNGLLLGTASFWEGVDVRGTALSCVIIDKLPFATPDDPVLQARAAAMQQAGRNPFMEYQLPTAVIALKQGVGRLIRDVTDRGVLVLCDPRLRTRSYGKVFLQSLPDMPVTRNVCDVENFFARDATAA